MYRWKSLITCLELKDYGKALQEITVIRDYDELQDLLQNIPFKKLNEDIPSSLRLLNELYTYLESFAMDKDEGRLILRQVFKVNCLLKNVILLGVDDESEIDAQTRHFIGQIAKVTWRMDRSCVDELVRFNIKLKSAVEHYENSKTLKADLTLKDDDIIANMKHCLNRYHSLILHLTSMTKEGNPRNILKSKSQLEEKSSYYPVEVNCVRQRLVLNQCILDVIEPYKEDIKQGPHLLESLKEMVEKDNTLLDVWKELPSKLTHREVTTSFDLEKILDRAKKSYNRILSHFACYGGSNVEILPQPLFYGELESSKSSRTHSYKKSRISSDQLTAEKRLKQELKKLGEKLAIKDEELFERRKLIEKMKKREEQLLQSVTDQAKKNLMRSEKFENICNNLPRTEELVDSYGNLYCQHRIDVMDELDNVASLNYLERSDEIKSLITFAVIVVSYHVTDDEMNRRLKKILILLGIDLKKSESGDYSSLSSEIKLQMRKSCAMIDLKPYVDEVMTGLCSTLFDFPELKDCQQLRKFIETCVQFCWGVISHNPPLLISYDSLEFDSSMHCKSHNSDSNSDVIKYHLWPTLFEDKEKVILYKGIVRT